MSASDPSDTRADHIVVLMFENRSFDNVLGRLYQPGKVPSFEGLFGAVRSNPVPPELSGGGAGTIEARPASSMGTPYPDPGEEYPHVNTQLFGIVDPPSNRLAEAASMAPPYNAPPERASRPASMDGFLRDYVNCFQARMGRPPELPEYAQIMEGYTPDQLPVLSELARGFACFDHWFCEVPSQTYPNRSFFHAASSSGFVLNGNPRGKFSRLNDAPTIFERLEAAHRSWRVYIDPDQLLSATGLIHARRLLPRFADRFRTIYDFYNEAHHGALPNYAFLEPNMIHPHTDMHPVGGGRWSEELGLRPPDAMAGGERLLAEVYEAIRTSDASSGSNWRNTLLLVTFDEHGGTYDHVPPPAISPPSPGAGEMGFGFDRLGVRVPSILISAWIPGRAVVTPTFHSTSLLRTLREWWELGGPLTGRDAVAPSLLPLLATGRPRDPESWPRVTPRPPTLGERAGEAFGRLVASLSTPLERLELDLLADALALTSPDGRPAHDVHKIGHSEAHDHHRRVGPEIFPGVHSGRQHR